MSIVTVVLMGVFAMKVPFDAMHQKRLFVLHLENVSFRCFLVLWELIVAPFFFYRSPRMNIISIWQLRTVPLVLNF